MTAVGTAHAALAWIALATIVALLVVSLLAVARPRRSYRAIDLAILAQLAATAATGLAGAVTGVIQAPPRDALHLLYGAVALGAPAVARAAAHRRGTRAVARWVAVGALVGLGATVRSFMTGG